MKLIELEYSVPPVVIKCQYALSLTLSLSLGDSIWQAPEAKHQKIAILVIQSC